MGSVSTITWKTLQASGLLRLMPSDEVAEDARHYLFIDNFNEICDEAQASWLKPRGFTLRDADPTHLSPADLAEEIHLTEDDLLIRYKVGLLLTNLQHRYPKYDVGFQPGELLALITIAAPLSPQLQADLAEARKQTDARLAVAPRPSYR